MRWTVGYNRIVKLFALFPINIGGCVAWLEMVYILQSRETDNWKNNKFVTKSDYKFWRKCGLLPTCVKINEDNRRLKSKSELHTSVERKIQHVCVPIKGETESYIIFVEYKNFSCEDGENMLPRKIITSRYKVKGIDDFSEFLEETKRKIADRYSIPTQCIEFIRIEKRKLDKNSNKKYRSRR